MGTRALVGRFQDDRTRFEARPIRYDGQPTWTLRQLADIYTHRVSGNAAWMHALLMARDWSLLNAATPRRRAAGQYVYVPGLGRGYTLEEGSEPVSGDRNDDRPMESRQWLYLWEHGFEALHVYLSAGNRWHHLATIDASRLAQVTLDVVQHIESREKWLQDWLKAAQ